MAVSVGTREKVEQVRKPTAARPPAIPKQQEDTVVRFDVHQRIQHVLMFTSFITLAATGLPQKFHGWSASQGLIALLGGLEATQQIHRIAAYVMIFDCFYHAVYLVRSVLLKRQFTALKMIPMPKDVLDAFKMFKYFLGLSDEKPRFGRFSYLEKFDYWAVFWGIFIIGGSGIILLFPVQISQILPGALVPVAHAAHSDEAVLAVGWIFVVHLFYVHLAPAVFPFNTSIFTGRMSKDRYLEEHPLEFERLYGKPEANHHALTADTEEVIATTVPIMAETAPANGTESVNDTAEPRASAAELAEGLPAEDQPANRALDKEQA